MCAQLDIKFKKEVREVEVDAGGDVTRNQTVVGFASPAAYLDSIL